MHPSVRLDGHPMVGRRMAKANQNIARKRKNRRPNSHKRNKGVDEEFEYGNLLGLRLPQMIRNNCLTKERSKDLEFYGTQAIEHRKRKRTNEQTQTWGV